MVAAARLCDRLELVKAGKRLRGAVVGLGLGSGVRVRVGGEPSALALALTWNMARVPWQSGEHDSEAGHEESESSERRT